MSKTSVNFKDEPHKIKHDSFRTPKKLDFSRKSFHRRDIHSQLTTNLKAETSRVMANINLSALTDMYDFPNNSNEEQKIKIV